MFEVFILLSFYLQSTVGETSQSNSAIIARGDSGGWGSGNGNTGLQSFFDIALTALAFLSFGIFLLNLLMNALLFTTGLTTGLTSTGPIITMTAPTATGGGETGGEAGFRGKRSIIKFDVDPTIAANVLAETVIKSIDAMVAKHECLPKVFCDGNRQAKLIGRGFEYLMPLYSISSSFVGEKLGFHTHLPDHLDAILYGVSESNCQSQFPQC